MFFLFVLHRTERESGVCVNFFLSNRPQVSMVYLQVNALSERIIRIYLHEFTNNERENSIPHEAAECGIENFEFIVSELVQVNPDNSLAECVTWYKSTNQKIRIRTVYEI